MRVNLAQEFVIAGYTPGPKNFDAIIFGYYAKFSSTALPDCKKGNDAISASCWLLAQVSTSGSRTLRNPTLGAPDLNRACAKVILFVQGPFLWWSRLRRFSRKENLESRAFIRLCLYNDVAAALPEDS